MSRCCTISLINTLLLDAVQPIINFWCLFTLISSYVLYECRVVSMGWTLLNLWSENWIQYDWQSFICVTWAALVHWHGYENTFGMLHEWVKKKEKKSGIDCSPPDTKRVNINGLYSVKLTLCSRRIKDEDEEEEKNSTNTSKCTWSKECLIFVRIRNQKEMRS